MRFVKTRAVAGAAKHVAKKDATHLTHAAEVEDDSGALIRVICGRVKLDNMLDDPFAVEDEDAPPTCPACLKKDPREGGKKGVLAARAKVVAALFAAESVVGRVQLDRMLASGQLTTRPGHDRATLAKLREEIRGQMTASRDAFLAALDAYLAGASTQEAILMSIGNKLRFPDPPADT